MAGSGGFWEGLRGSHTMRLAIIGVLVLVLQLPISIIGSLVSERQARRDEAVDEVASKWGNSQTITGPMLVVPYTTAHTETTDKGRTVVRLVGHQAVFLPRDLTIKASVKSETRRRGIYAVPLYRLTASVSGSFAPPSFADLGVQPRTVQWDRAQLALGITDVRAIGRAASVTWAGRPVAFRPGMGRCTEAQSGIHALVGAPEQGRTIPFSFDLALNGCVGAYFVPVGETTVVDMQCDHPSPSFQGGWLPVSRTVTAQGFTARWSIPSLGRNYPQAWEQSGAEQGTLEGSRFGLDLVEPVDHYRMAERSTKYASLFIALTFGTIWLIEVLAGLRVHPIQYLLLGAALCLFYLLELSLSEHIGFHRAYTLASGAIVAMLGTYCVTVLRRASRALAVAAGTAALYAFLWTLLTNEDNALLIGSLGLFVIVAAVMLLTRHMDWNSGARAGGQTG